MLVQCDQERCNYFESQKLLTEKHYIIKSLDNNQLLNLKSELVSKCRHIKKNILSGYKCGSND